MFLEHTRNLAPRHEMKLRKIVPRMMDARKEDGNRQETTQRQHLETGKGQAQGWIWRYQAMRAKRRSGFFWFLDKRKDVSKAR